MRFVLHQTLNQLADFEGILKSIELAIEFDKNTPTIHLFGEFFLTGYPLQDLCLTKQFQEKYFSFQNRVQNLFKNNPSIHNESLFLMGGPDYLQESEDQKRPKCPPKVGNALFQFDKSGTCKRIYWKQLLPNYDIFDEKKYYQAGNDVGFLHLKGLNLGIFICEDMWNYQGSASINKHEPVSALVQFLQKEQKTLDGVINFSASPFSLGKLSLRFEKAKEISHLFQCPLIYINSVGEEDLILFDGQSFVVDRDEVQLQLRAFAPDTAEVIIDGNGNGNGNKKNVFARKESPDSQRDLNFGDSNFPLYLDFKVVPCALVKLTDSEMADTINALLFGLIQYSKKAYFKEWIIALSGGMDSALVLMLAHLAKRSLISRSPSEDINIKAVYMPSLYSSDESRLYSEQLCSNLGIELIHFPIKFLHSVSRRTFADSIGEELVGLGDENIQSRLRGLLLYTLSNHFHSMVINTSNKSELAVGYSTMYGDSVGALSLLGDLYKTEIYQLANYINREYKGPIPEGIITRAPTAELRTGQTDQASLPPYEILDAILEGLLSYQMSGQDLVNAGHDVKVVKKVMSLFSVSEFKRKQFCPIVKIKRKSFGYGYRIPITKHSSLMTI